MIYYAEPLPPMKQLIMLARNVSFPSSRKEVTDMASQWIFSRELFGFLKLFPANEVFESKADFLARCEELEMLIEEEREMPPEMITAAED